MDSEAIVHIVEDDEAHQSAICLIVESVGLKTRVYGSALQFLEEFDFEAADGPQCLVTDVRLPGMSGLELQDTLIQQKISLPTVVISGHADVPIAVQAVKKGAIDFIEKPFRQQALLDAIQAALAQSRDLMKTEQSHSLYQSRLAGLTARQKEVMALMVDGKPNKIIADELGLSVKTVEQHRALVMKNMGAASFADLVHMAVENGDF
jgi:FixJ family two-component response regulator